MTMYRVNVIYRGRKVTEQVSDPTLLLLGAGDPDEEKLQLEQIRC